MTIYTPRGEYCEIVGVDRHGRARVRILRAVPDATGRALRALGKYQTWSACQLRATGGLAEIKSAIDRATRDGTAAPAGHEPGPDLPPAA